MALGKKTGGRKRGTPNRGVSKPYKVKLPEGITPLDYLLDVMRSPSPSVTLEHRLIAAKAAAQYCHRALKAVEHTGEEGGPIKVQHGLGWMTLEEAKARGWA